MCFFTISALIMYYSTWYYFKFIGPSSSIWLWRIILSSIWSWYASVIHIGILCSAFRSCFLLHTTFEMCAILFKVIISGHGLMIVRIVTITIWLCCYCYQYEFLFSIILLRYVSQKSISLALFTLSSILVSYCNVNASETYLIT